MYTTTYHPFNTKSASSLESRQQVADIMDRIRAENPGYWPYGLSIGHHDGGVYMVRKASTNEPVGFVGWQERRKGLEKVGYYSIGILPEYRGQGLAREAVSKIIREKAAGVDRVQALIARNNLASRALARSLDIPVEEV
jgi:RimJ/RimL family protein N-acetyltransferase